MTQPLTTDLSRGDARPYFLWDDELSLDEFRSQLRSPDPDTADRALARLLREARYEDVWRFVTPQEISDRLPRLLRFLGRSTALWTHLIHAWKDLGLLR